MPPLREHKEDIYDLCIHFLKEFSSSHNKPFSLSQEALTCLESYPFPGNARELRNLMERASVLSKGPTITPGDLPTELCSKNAVPAVGFNLAKNMAVAEHACIKKALGHCDDNRTETAALLGISRKNLWEKMKNHRIE